VPGYCLSAFVHGRAVGRHQSGLGGTSPLWQCGQRDKRLWTQSHWSTNKLILWCLCWWCWCWYTLVLCWLVVLYSRMWSVRAVGRVGRVGCRVVGGWWWVGSHISDFFLRPRASVTFLLGIIHLVERGSTCLGPSQLPAIPVSQRLVDCGFSPVVSGQWAVCTQTRLGGSADRQQAAQGSQKWCPAWPSQRAHSSIANVIAKRTSSNVS
jgi:hypothetical protein